MKKNFLLYGMIMIALMIFASACSKYDEGPGLSLYSKGKRVQGRWYFSRVLYNDVDSTDVYRVEPIQAIEFLLDPERGVDWSAYTWNRNMGVNTAGAAQIDYGFWRFSEEMDSLRMITTIKVWPGVDAIQDTTEYNWKIIRLAYTEFWLERMADDTTKIQWKLWKLAY